MSAARKALNTKAARKATPSLQNCAAPVVAAKLSQVVGEAHVRELTAIHAHAAGLALAVSGYGADAFRDHELSAILFDLEERLMRVRDALAGVPTSAEGRPS